MAGELEQFRRRGILMESLGGHARFLHQLALIRQFKLMQKSRGDPGSPVTA
jgi:hypothetical protein